MAPISTELAAPKTPYKLDTAQTLRASTALLKKLQSEDATEPKTGEKRSLLADADAEDVEDETPVWLVLTTKKHIVDKKRLKPGKILLPHPCLDTEAQEGSEGLRICLITADPQRKYKELLDTPGFPAELRDKVKRVVGLEKLKAKYKSFETRRQLLSEYDVFLADDRVITYLPTVLGKTFYKGGSKRPIPVNLQGSRQSIDEKGNKRRKLSEGGAKVVKSEVKPQDVGHEIQRALNSALVHLAPSTTTAVKVGRASMEPEHLQENVEAVVAGMVDRYVPQQWRGVKSIHIKGPNTAALPIWLTDELWADEADVLDEPLPVKEKPLKKRKRGALAEGVDEPSFIEIPGPDGKMRRIENPAAGKHKVDGIEGGEPSLAVKSAKKRKSETGAAVDVDDVLAKATEKAEKQARKEGLRKQKEEAKKAGDAATTTKVAAAVNGDGVGVKKVKKTRAKAADLI